MEHPRPVAPTAGQWLVCARTSLASTTDSRQRQPTGWRYRLPPRPATPPSPQPPPSSNSAVGADLKQLHNEQRNGYAAPGQQPLRGRCIEYRGCLPLDYLKTQLPAVPNVTYRAREARRARMPTTARHPHPEGTRHCGQRRHGTHRIPRHRHQAGRDHRPPGRRTRPRPPRPADAPGRADHT